MKKKNLMWNIVSFTYSVKKRQCKRSVDDLLSNDGTKKNKVINSRNVYMIKCSENFTNSIVHFAFLVTIIRQKRGKKADQVFSIAGKNRNKILEPDFCFSSPSGYSSKVKQQV